MGLKEQRRREILDAARRCFAARGYHETGIAEIAGRLGVGHGTIYRYFRNKRAIFTEIMQDGIAAIAEVRAREQPAPATNLRELREQWGRVFLGVFRMYQEDEDRALLLLHEGLGVDEELRGSLNASFDLFVTFTAHDIRNGKHRGFLRSDLDEQTVARAVNALMFEAMRRSSRAEDASVAAAQWAVTIDKLVFQGLAARRK